MLRHILLLLFLLLLVGPFATAAAADRGVFLTPEEALALAFPEAEVTKQTVYLTDEQRAEVERLAGAPLCSGIARPYVAVDADGDRVGIAWFDTHTVRSQRETLMTVVDSEGAIERIELLAFGEPLNYLPKPSFFAQFQGKRLDELRLGRGIRAIAGATMSARATLGATRRGLALTRILFPVPEPEPLPEPQPGPQPGPQPEPRPVPESTPPSSQRTQRSESVR